MPAMTAESRLSVQAGNPLLGQIREFIQTEEPPPLDPLGLAARAVHVAGLAEAAPGLESADTDGVAPHAAAARNDHVETVVDRPLLHDLLAGGIVVPMR